MNKAAIIGGASLAAVSLLLLARQSKRQSYNVRPGRHPAWNLSTSPAGVTFIKQKEGFRAEPYLDDSAATPNVVEYAIGYGHQIRPGENYTYITPGDAAVLLATDLKRYEDYVRQNANVPLTQNEFDALVSWTYNTGNRPSSTLYKKLNDGDYMGAANEFAKWRMAGGKVHSGLVQRRKEERALFIAEAPASTEQTAALADGNLSAVA